MSNIKIILFDVDGVIIRPPYYFSKELEKQGYNNAVEILNSFFNGEDNVRCLEGKADSKETIMPYLQKFGWKGTAEQFLRQQFRFESRYLDKNIISLIGDLRRQGTICGLSTNQDKNRAKFLLKVLNFQNFFDKHFISCHIGFRKCNDNFWVKVIDNLTKEFLNLKLNEIVFFDDNQDSISAASKFGIQTFLFKNINQFEKDMDFLGLQRELQRKKPIDS